MSSFIDSVVGKLNSKDVHKFSDVDIFADVDLWVHTGSPTLDMELGTLGVPVGLTEVRGKSRSGKTTFTMMGLKHFKNQNPEGVGVILSSEYRDNQFYAQKIGIDPEEVIIVKVRYVEQMFLRVKEIIAAANELWEEEGKEGKPKFYFIWDSVGLTYSKTERDNFEENLKIMKTNKEKGLEETEKERELKVAAMASFARAAKTGAKYIKTQVYDNDIVFSMINHTIANIGSIGRKSVGGEWIELIPTMRLELYIKQTLKVRDEAAGQITHVKVIKNDFDSPGKEIPIEIKYGHGVILSEQDIEFGVAANIIDAPTKKVRQYGSLRWSTKAQFYSFYDEAEPELEELHDKLMKAAHKEVKRRRLKAKLKAKKKGKKKGAGNLINKKKKKI